MGSRIDHTIIRSKGSDICCFNIPVESIRKTRSLNLDRHSCSVSWEVYKIVKSKNGRKIFT